MTNRVGTETDPLTPNRRILLGGIDRGNVETLLEYLAEIDCVTRVATNAEEIAATLRDFQPAILLLNPMIPKGFDFCRNLKNSPEQRKTLVLMIAELTNVSDIERAVKAGVDDFIGLPVGKSDLLPRVKNLLRLSGITDDDGDLP